MNTFLAADHVSVFPPRTKKKRMVLLQNQNLAEVV